MSYFALNNFEIAVWGVITVNIVDMNEWPVFLFIGWVYEVERDESEVVL